MNNHIRDFRVRYQTTNSSCSTHIRATGKKEAVRIARERFANGFNFHVVE